MKRMLTILFVLVMLFGISAQGVFASNSEEPIYIAIITPRTGDSTQYGTYMVNGVMLKVDEVNANGGINGRQIVVDIFDDGNVPQQSASLAQIVVDDPKYLAAIGPFNTPCTLAAATVFDEGKVVEMVPNAGADTVHTEHTYTIRQQNTNTTEFTYLGQVAMNDLGAQKVAIIYINNDSGIISQRVVAETVTGLGGEVVISEGIMPDQISDYTSMLTKIREGGADTIVTTANAPDVATIIKQSKQLGMDDITWLSTGTVYTDEFLNVGGEAVNGVYCLTTYFSGNPAPRIAAWTERYLAKYPGTTPNYFVTGAFECTSMLCWAFEEGALDRVSLYEKLLTIREWDGETGLSVYSEDRNILKNMTILQIKSGKFEMANFADSSQR